MNKKTIFLCIVLIFLIFGIKEASACEVVFPTPDSKENYENADMVFWGKVIETKQIIPGDERFFEIFFEVQRIWKGFDSDRISMISHYTGCYGPPNFIKGQNYLVFLTEEMYGDSFSNYTNTSLAWIRQAGPTFTFDEIIYEKGAGFTPLKTPEGFENSSGEESNLSSLAIETTDEIPICKKKEKDPNAPIQRGGHNNFHVIDTHGNSLSSVKIGQETFFFYGIGNEDSTKCIMEIEIFVKFDDKNGDEKLVFYKKSSETFEPGEGKQFTWDFIPIEEGEHNIIIKPKGFPPTNAAITVYPPAQHYFAPLKQISNGILPENVVCKSGMKLIFKSTDFSPACVKPSTALELVKRNWNIFDKNLIEVSTDKSQYKIGEKVLVTIKNVGMHPAFFGSGAYGFTIFDSSEKRVITCGVYAQGVPRLMPNEHVLRSWRTDPECMSETIPQGEYSIFVKYFVDPKLTLPPIETEKQMILIT